MRVFNGEQVCLLYSKQRADNSSFRHYAQQSRSHARIGPLHTEALRTGSSEESFSCHSLTNVQVARTEEFLHLPVDDLIDILRRDELHVSNEEQVFEAAMRWLSYKEDSRSECRASVLKNVRVNLENSHRTIYLRCACHCSNPPI